MPLPLRTVTYDLTQFTGVEFGVGEVYLQITPTVSTTADGHIVPAISVDLTPDAVGQGTFDAVPGDLGVPEFNYNVAIYRRTDGGTAPYRKLNLPSFRVPVDAGPFALADLMADGIPPAETSYWRSITQIEYDAVIAAADSAAASAIAAAADAAKLLSIDAFAELATKFVYSSPGVGQQIVAVGNVILWRAIGVSIEVLADNAVAFDFDYTGTGGIKARLVSVVTLSAMGATANADASAAFTAALNINTRETGAIFENELPDLGLVIDLEGKTWIIDDNIIWPVGAGITLKNGGFIAGPNLVGKMIQFGIGVGFGTFAGNVIKHARCRFQNLTFDGAHRVGVDMIYSQHTYNMEWDNIRYVRCKGVAWEVERHLVDGLPRFSHETRMNNIQFHEYPIGSPGFDVGTNRTGTALKIDGVDNEWHNIIVGRTATALVCSAGNFFTNLHTYGGVVTLRYVNFSGTSYLHSLAFTNCYFDNHTVFKIHNPAKGVTFVNCQFYIVLEGSRDVITLVADSVAFPAEITIIGCMYKSSSPIGVKRSIVLDETGGSFASIKGTSIGNTYWDITRSDVEKSIVTTFDDVAAGAFTSKSLVVRDLAAATVYSEVDGAAGSNTGLRIRSAGAAIWSLFRRATTNHFEIFGGVGGITPLKINHATGHVALQAPTAVVDNAFLNTGQVSFSLDETTNEIVFRVKYSGGTVRTGRVALI